MPRIARARASSSQGRCGQVLLLYGDVDIDNLFSIDVKVIRIMLMPMIRKRGHMAWL